MKSKTISFLIVTVFATISLAETVTLQKAHLGHWNPEPGAGVYTKVLSDDDSYDQTPSVNTCVAGLIKGFQYPFGPSYGIRANVKLDPTYDSIGLLEVEIYAMVPISDRLISSPKFRKEYPKPGEKRFSDVCGDKFVSSVLTGGQMNIQRFYRISKKTTDADMKVFKNLTYIGKAEDPSSLQRVESAIKTIEVANSGADSLLQLSGIGFSYIGDSHQKISNEIAKRKDLPLSADSLKWYADLYNESHDQVGNPIAVELTEYPSNGR